MNVLCFEMEAICLIDDFPCQEADQSSSTSVYEFRAEVDTCAIAYNMFAIRNLLAQMSEHFRTGG